MSPNTLGFVLQWPLTALLTWYFKVHYDWAWVVAGAAGIFAAMGCTWVLVMGLSALRRRRAPPTPLPRPPESQG